MRVANKTLFDSSMFRLGQNTEALNNSNEVMSTQKRINRLSDDPVGLTQVLDLKSALDNLEQLEKNVALGKTWLDAGDTSQDTVGDLILEAKVLAGKMVNASMSVDERNDAAVKVEMLTRQIMMLGNTQVQGNYIYGGTKTEVPPLSVDSDTGKVVYGGNDDPFKIQFSTTQTVEVGRDGKEVFWDDYLEVDLTNNQLMFREDVGDGSESERVVTAVVPNGKYTREELAVEVRNAMNTASAKDGFGAEYEVSYDADTETYSIRENGSFDGFLGFNLMIENSEDARVENLSVGGRVDLDDAHLVLNRQDSVTIGTPENEPMTLTWDGAGEWKLTNNPGYDGLTVTTSDDGKSVVVDLLGNGGADITVNLDNPPTAEGDLISFDLVPRVEDRSIGPDLGFSDSNVSYAPAVSDSPVTAFTDLTVDFTNNKIDFMEIDANGKATPLTATILGPGNETVYTFTDPDVLGRSIEAAMERASAAVTPFPPNPPVDYSVSYDPVTSRFSFKEETASLKEVRMLWNTGPNALLGTGAGDSLGFVNTDNAGGSFGGDLTANGWDVGDTVSVTFTDGVNTLEYSRAVTVFDTNFDILDDMRFQLQAAFGEDADFTLNGNNIEFSLNKDRNFVISGMADGATNDARLEIGVPDASGSFGGDLMGALNWETGDTINIDFSDGTVVPAPLLQYSHTVSHARGSFGGGAAGFLANGWEAGDTVSFTVTDGINSLDYSYTVGGADTDATIRTDMLTALQGAFGPDAAFAVNGNNIDFSLAHGRTLTISDLQDTGGATQASLQIDTAASNLPTTVPSTIISGGINRVDFFSDSNELLLQDMSAQLNAAFGANADFTVKDGLIDYTMYGNRELTIGPVDDARSGNAALLRTDGGTTALTSPPPGGPAPTFIDVTGGIANFNAAAGDDAVTFPESDNPLTLFRVSNQNNRVNFQEVDGTNATSSEFTAVIPPGDYGAADISDLEEAVEEAMEFASANRQPPEVPPAVPIRYDATYDAATGKFTIEEEQGATGSFGGGAAGFLANGWSTGETVSFDMTFGTTTQNISVGPLTGTTDSEIADEVAAALGIGGTDGSAVFEDPAGKVTITRVGDSFSFDTTEGLSFNIANVADTVGANAGMSFTAVNLGVPATAVIPNGDPVGITAAPDPKQLKEIHLLWGTGADQDKSAADLLGFNSDQRAAGTMGGDLMGALNWDLGDTVAMDFTDGVNTLGYSKTIETARGSFGGELLQMGWEPGETIELSFYDGVTRVDYAHTVAMGESNADILASIHAAMNPFVVANGDTFNINGNMIDFTLNPPTTNRFLTVSGFKDSGNNDASLDTVSANTAGVVENISAGGVNSVVFTSDTTDSLLADMADQLNAAFRTDGDFTVEGKEILFNLNRNRVFTVDNFTDNDVSGTGNIADFEVAGNLGLPPSGIVSPVISANVAGQDTINFYAADDDIGLSGTGDNKVPLVTVDSTNNMIDFEEKSASGLYSGPLAATIPPGEYTSMDDLAQAVETAMEAVSAESGNGVDYEVTYDSVARKFHIKENGTTLDGLDLNFVTGANRENTAARTLGFDQFDSSTDLFEKGDAGVVHITLDNTNNRIDFREYPRGSLGKEALELSAVIPPGEYTSLDELAKAMEEALEAESKLKGAGADYAVSVDADTGKFTVKEAGTSLDRIDLLWGTGSHKSASAAGVLGFDAEDDVSTQVYADGPAEWSIFNTLEEFQGYLENNDVDGIERTLSRLETHYEKIVGVQADTGFKYNRLQFQEKISVDMDLALDERRSSLEDADIVEATMNLKSIELAYQAALNSTSKVLSVSLVDFL